MAQGAASYRQILKSSSIIGGASTIRVILGLVRIKVAALVLGPAGIGLVGLFNNVIATAAELAGMGFNSAGTRQIAAAEAMPNPQVKAASRRALTWGSWFFALSGAALMWLSRNPVAEVLFGNPAYSREIGWLGVGVALTVVAASRTALLNGLRLIGDLARVSILSAVTSTALGIGVLWIFGEAGLVGFVITGPLAAFAVAGVFVLRVSPCCKPPAQSREIFLQWRKLVNLGFPFMLGGLVGKIAELSVRAMIQQEVGLEALGFFQASWVISMTYISLVLGAMGADFYPRLTGVIADPTAANRLVNEQTEVAVLLAGPLLLAVLALAPWVIGTLYSPAFSPAATILRWQVLGDILKVASFPLGFMLLAAGDGWTFLFADASAFFVFAFTALFGLPALGVEATGMSFFLMYAYYLSLVYWLGVRRTGFRWGSSVRKHVLALTAASVLTLWLSERVRILGTSFGMLASVGFGIFAVNHMAQRIALHGKGGRWSTIRQVFSWSKKEGQ